LVIQFLQKFNKVSLSLENKVQNKPAMAGACKLCPWYNSCKKWANGVSGKSGGSLSAFWTPERGTAILGRPGGKGRRLRKEDQYGFR